MLDAVVALLPVELALRAPVGTDVFVLVIDVVAVLRVPSFVVITGSCASVAIQEELTMWALVSGPVVIAASGPAETGVRWADGISNGAG